MAYADLRQYLRSLEHDGQLKRVAEPVDPELESTSFCLRTLKANGPALLFEQPRGSQIPLLGNLFGSRARIEAALAGRPLTSLNELGELLAAHHPCVHSPLPRHGPACPGTQEWREGDWTSCPLGLLVLSP
jgi:4-hydroxy-3-polyprenylbenzoate decarboxylase